MSPCKVPVGFGVAHVIATKKIWLDGDKSSQADEQSSFSRLTELKPFEIDFEGTSGIFQFKIVEDLWMDFSYHADCPTPNVERRDPALQEAWMPSLLDLPRLHAKISKECLCAGFDFREVRSWIGGDASYMKPSLTPRFSLLDLDDVGDLEDPLRVTRMSIVPQISHQPR